MLKKYDKHYQSDEEKEPWIPSVTTDVLSWKY